MAFTSTDQFLATDIVMLIFAILSLIGNGFILTIFFTHRKLRKNANLYLIIALAVNDVAISCVQIPNAIFLIAYLGWFRVIFVNFSESIADKLSMSALIMHAVL